MKIVLFFLGRKGAGPVYSIEMAKALSYQANLLLVLSTEIENKQQWLDFFSSKENVTIKFFKTYNNKLSFLFNSLNIFNYYRIINTIKFYKPNAIYIPFNHLWGPLIFPFLQNIKIYSTLHDVKVHLGENIIFSTIQKLNLKLVHKIIILNNKDVGDVLKLNFSNENICVIPHATFKYYNTKELKLKNVFSNKLLFIGRIEKYKGLDLLLDAFALALEKNPNLKLTIAGNGDLKDYLPKIKYLKKSITIVNKWLSEDEIQSLVSETNLVVLPYLEASQSGIIPLAFGFGKTVIATNVGALQEQVPIGTGLIIEPNIIKLFEAINHMFSNEEIIFEYSKNAKKYADEFMTWDKSADLLLNFIRKTNN